MVHGFTFALPSRRRLWAAISLVLFLWLGGALLSSAADYGTTPSQPQAQLGPHPFDYPERVEYVASWNGIPLASAKIQAAPSVVDGKSLYEVKVSAQTWRYLDPIWKMRDTVESLFDAGSVYPRRFIFRQRENRKSVDTTANFDPGAQKWIVRRQNGNKVQNSEFIAPRTFDPISATYWARTLDFKVGDSIQLEVFGGKSFYRVILNVVGREKVAVKAGEFDAYKIVPQVFNLSKSGLAEKVREATVWISADDARMPVKINSKVTIGSVSIEMVRKSAGAL